MKKINEYFKDNDRTAYYFKNEINWKLFNYIIDKMTCFDDEEIDYIISISVYYKQNEEFLHIYNYTSSTEHGDYTGDDYLEEKRRKYDGTNLVFYIQMIGRDISPYSPYRVELINKLNSSGKFEVEYSYLSDKNLILKPKK